MILIYYKDKQKNRIEFKYNNFIKIQLFRKK